MAKIAKSGCSDEALTIPATDVREMMTGGFKDASRIFWARHFWVTNSHATTTALVQIYDQDEGAATAANEKFSFYAPPQVTTVVEIPEPGIKFETNVAAATTNGTIAIYQCGCGGFEEGPGA